MTATQTKTKTKASAKQALQAAGLATGIAVWILVIGGGLLATYNYYAFCSITVKPACLWK